MDLKQKVKIWEAEVMKKRKIKIVTIGGGSSYTPELIEGFIKRKDEQKTIGKCKLLNSSERKEVKQ